MPSIRITGSTLSLNRFEVIGQDGSESNFVRHVGLAESAGSQNAATIAVLEMGPPLRGHGTAGHIKADVVGGASLTDDEVQKIKTFVDRHASEHLLFSQFTTSQLIQLAPQMYCIRPHASPFYEEDGRYSRTRFSCTGFVLEAYKSARIKLLDLKGLPMVDMAVIAAAYPETRLIKSGRISAEELGVGGDGPWPVLLCGYLFHALNRKPEIIRKDAYVPNIKDRYFT